jgi:hypothetical protein
MRFIDAEGYFVSEASVYRLLKARELIAGPVFIVIGGAAAFNYDHGAQLAVANRLHLYEGDWLGLDRPVDRAR